MRVYGIMMFRAMRVYKIMRGKAMAVDGTMVGGMRPLTSWGGQ